MRKGKLGAKKAMTVRTDARNCRSWRNGKELLPGTADAPLFGLA